MSYVCFCGYRADSAEALQSHMEASGCNQFVGTTELIHPEVAQTRAREERAREESKKARVQTFKEERRDSQCLLLARKRFIELVPASYIDGMKADHVAINNISEQYCVRELGKHLKHLVPPEVWKSALKIIADSFDVYEGIRTEKQEMAHLRTLICIIEPVERPLKGGGKVYDFMMDELVLRLLQQSPTAREQVFETIETWKTKPPDGRGVRGNPLPIIADITDASVFLEHPVFGVQCRVTPEEARRTSKTMRLQLAFLMYADAFDVRGNGFALRPRPHTYTLALPPPPHTRALLWRCSVIEEIVRTVSFVCTLLGWHSQRIC